MFGPARVGFENVGNVRGHDEGGEEPKSIEEIAHMSSVSTSYKLSNALPRSEAFAGVGCSARRYQIIHTHPTTQVKGNVVCSYDVIGIKRFDVRRCNRGV